MKNFPEFSLRKLAFKPTLKPSFKLQKYALACLLCVSVNSGYSQEAQNRSRLLNLPDLGAAGADALTERAEAQLGVFLWRDVKTDSDFISDPAVSEYLRRLTTELMNAGKAVGAMPDSAGRMFRAFAVADSRVNAFALPGGLLGVHSGLILGAESEGELAAVLAHEMGHVGQRHFARSLDQSKQTDLLQAASMLVAILAARSNAAQSGEVLRAAVLGGQASSTALRLSFSRDMEREADAVGLELLKASGREGYDMVRMLRRLANVSLGNANTPPKGSYASSHPDTTERMSNTEARLGYAKRNEYAANSAQGKLAQQRAFDFALFQARLRNLVVNVQSDKLAAFEFFEAGLEEAKTESARLAMQYGLLLSLKQLRAHNNFPKDPYFEPLLQAYTDLAITAANYEKVSATARHPWISMALADGKVPNVRDLDYANAVKKFPENKELILQWAALMQKNIDPNKASQNYIFEYELRPNLTLDLIKVLADYCKQNTEDDQAWTYLAGLYQLQNKTSDMHAALAEGFVAQGSFLNALNQLDLASKGLDFQAQSRIDVRRGEIRAQQQREKQFENPIK